MVPRAGTIDKAIGAGQNMLAATPMVTTKRGRKTMIMAMETTITVITEMVTITVTSSDD
jgi:hypothetical protein